MFISIRCISAYSSPSGSVQSMFFTTGAIGGREGNLAQPPQIPNFVGWGARQGPQLGIDLLPADRAGLDEEVPHSLLASVMEVVPIRTQALLHVFLVKSFVTNSANLPVFAQCLNFNLLLSLLHFSLSGDLDLFFSVFFFNLPFIFLDNPLARKTCAFLWEPVEILNQTIYPILVALHNLLTVLGLVLVDGLVFDDTLAFGAVEARRDNIAIAHVLLLEHLQILFKFECTSHLSACGQTDCQYLLSHYNEWAKFILINKDRYETV